MLTRQRDEDQDQNGGNSGQEQDNSSDVFPVLPKNVTVMKARKNTNNRRDNKADACLFCEENALHQNIARHMSRAHANETEVVKILLLKKGSKERRRAWRTVINKGNFAHNISVLEKKSGVIIPKYRARSEDPDAEKYIPCDMCHAFFSKGDLWKHQKKCRSTTQSGGRAGRGQAVARGRLLLPVPHLYSANSKFYLDILSDMKDDEVKRAVLGDPRISDFGSRLYFKHGHEPSHHNYIRTKLRELGRLLIGLKGTVKTIDECLDPENWDIVMKAVREVAGYNEDTNQYQTPSLALKIGHSLVKCAGYLKTEGLKENNKEKIDKGERFTQLYQTEWSDNISSKALSTLETNKYNKPQLLPLVEDVVKLHNMLEKKARTLVETLVKDPTVYAELAKVMLTMVILFNRKRSGEAERMLLESFLTAQTSPPTDPAVLASLSVFEQHLCKTHLRVEVRGKRGRKVAVLLTAQMKEDLNSLIKARTAAGVSSQRYLFARPGQAEHPYRGSDCLREFAQESGAKQPKLLTSTMLRKQLATLAQVLNLSENSQDILAAFQGHDIRVHREFYRLPEGTLQVAKITKLLHCINDGTITHFKGKDFDDIEFNEQGM